MPTSSSGYSNGIKKYKLTNTASTVKNGEIYLAQRSTISASGDYGWRPYTSAFVVELTGASKITINVKSNTTSAREITGQVYTMAEPFYNIYKNTAIDSSLEEYVIALNKETTKTDEESAIVNIAAFKAITGFKDANKKLLIGESGEIANASTKYGGAISHNCPTTKGGTNSFEVEIETSGKYLIYLTSDGSSVGITSIVITPSALATTFTVTYNANNGSGTMEPTTNEIDECSFTYEGKDFVEWNTKADGTGESYAPGDAVTDNLNLYAIWQAETPKYDVTYDLNGGTGTAPTQGKVAENGTFTVASAEGITPPTGKEFAGWSDGTTTYAAGATYTMGAAAVTFTAQWKAAPTVLFHWRSNTGSYAVDAKNGTTIGGTTTLRTNDTEKSWGKDSATYDSAVADDMKGETSNSELKSSGNALYLELTLTSGTFQEGDIIYVTGYNPWGFSTNQTFNSFDVVASITTGSSKTDVKTGSGVILEGVNASTIYVRRAEGASSGIAAIKVIRPAQKEILSTDITLSAVAVNTEAISADNLATLKTDPYKLDLTSEYAEAPTIAFTKQTVITYEDATTKTKTEAIEVAAIEVDGKWQAQTEINAITYTVTALIPATYTVIYKDGETILASETVKVGEHPTAAGVTTNPHYSLSWKLGDEAVELANVNGTADQEITLVAVLTAKYASSFDFGAATDLTKDNIAAKLAAVNILVTVGSGGAYDNGETTGYLGYKFKNKGDKLSFLLQKGYRAVITYGFTQSGWTVNDEDAGIVTAQTTYVEKTYTAASADMLYTLVNKSKDSKTSVITKIVIEEIPAISDDATLKDIQVNGTTIEGFNPEKKIYYLTVPYGTDVASMPKITNAVANHGSASVVIYPTEGPEWTNEYGGCYLQQIVVTAEDGIAKGYYHVRTTVDAKEGVTIIKATHTGATTADVIGAIGGTCDKNTQDGGKLGSNGHYFGIKLAEGTFKSGDVIKVVASALNGGNTITLFADKEGTTAIGSVDYDSSTKTAYFTLTADVENVYIYRASSACNSNVEYIEVQRFMDPFIETFEVAGTLGVVNQSTKTITIEVPASTDVTSLTPTITAWANGGATVTPTGAKDFTSPVTYSVASAYAEDGVTTYTVTINKAAASTDATLQELTINGTAIPLVAGQYEYEYELPYGTNIAPEVVAEANDANATAVVTSVSLTEAVITVTAENGATQEYVINFTVSPWQNIVIWDGSTMDAVAASPDASGLTWEVNGFKSIAGYTTTCGSKTYSKVLPSGGSASDSRNFKIVIPDGYLAKFYIAFASHEDGNLRGMSIGTTINKNSDTSIYGAECSTRSEALGGTSVIVGAGTYYINPIASIDFCEVSVLLRPGYIRTGLTVGSLGTICLPSNVPAGQAFGATFYKLEGKEPQYGKIVFDEIPSGELEAGKPYLFQANAAEIVCYYGTTSVSSPDNSGAMKGTFEDMTLTDLTNIYYFAQKALWSCVDLTSLSVPANRAYVKMDEMPAISESNPAPGVRRITLGVNGQNTATGVENMGTSEQPMKMIINGQLYIIRGEKTYDAQGKLVK